MIYININDLYIYIYIKLYKYCFYLRLYSLRFLYINIWHPIEVLDKKLCLVEVSRKQIFLLDIGAGWHDLIRSAEGAIQRSWKEPSDISRVHSRYHQAWRRP